MLYSCEAGGGVAAFDRMKIAEISIENFRFFRE
jgi:hypothetical protein